MITIVGYEQDLSYRIVRSVEADDYYLIDHARVARILYYQLPVGTILRTVLQESNFASTTMETEENSTLRR